MLGDVKVQPMLPVSDLPAAETFYEQTLGLKRVGGMPGVATTYKSGDTTLNVYKSDYAGTNQGTAALWEVDDVEATAKELKSKGVELAEEPTEQSYGIDFGLRDPFGNNIRIAQRSTPTP